MKSLRVTNWTVKIALAGIVPMLVVGCISAAPEKTVPEKGAASVRTGEQIFTSCLLCHSTREMQRGPIIDGLPAWYVEVELRNFRDGIRGRNPKNKSALLMGAGESIVHDEEEIKRVAEHISQLPPQPHLLTVKGDKYRGKLIYLQCMNCHGVHAEGRKEAQSPPLNTLEDWYQLDQLRKFKSSLRGEHPKDAPGNAMRVAVLGLSDADMKNVTRYIAEELAAAKPLTRGGKGKK